MRTIDSVIHDRIGDQTFDAGDRARIVRLFDRSLDVFQRTFGRAASAAWWVPGRIEVFGKHTDYAGGRSLIATVPRGFAFVGAPRSDGVVHIVDAASGDARVVSAAPRREERPLERSTAAGPDWGRYIRVVADRLSDNFPPGPIGADLAFLSDLPPAAGVSSSSALTVGVAMSLVGLNRLDRHPAWRTTLDGSIAVANYLSCVENGMSYGALRGGAGVGTLSGSEDHTAMLCCRPGELSVYAFVPVRHVEDAPMPEDWAFVIATSGVVAEKIGAAQVLYNRAALSVKALLDLWNAAEPPQPSLAAALGSSEEAFSRLVALIDRADHRDWSRTDLRRRLTQFAREDARMPLAARAFREQDASALGVLSAESHHEADTLLGNQIEETNALVELARQSGAHGASAFGAGFGGSVWALVSRAEAAAFGERWLAAYRARFPQHSGATWFKARPGPAMLEMVPDENEE